MSKMWIDTYIFHWLKKQLANATPDQIAAFYVEKFILHNEGYLEHLQKEYNLPDDILKIHQKICQLAP